MADQAAFEVLAARFDANFRGLAMRIGDRGLGQTFAVMDALVQSGHASAYALGNPGVSDEDLVRIARSARDAESFYFRGFASDLAAEDERYLNADGSYNVDAVHRRMRMYEGRMRGTANTGWVDSQPDGTQFYWVLGASEHCEDCEWWASGNPHTAASLAVVPGSNDTACLFNCRCRLEVRRQGRAERSFEYPALPEVESVAPRHDLADALAQMARDGRTLARLGTIVLVGGL